MAEQASKVSGVVQIDGTPVERTVRAFGYEAQTHAIDGNEVTLSRTLGHATSDPETGEYTIDLLDGYAQRVFVVAFDDYGADFTPDMALTVGDRVHPTTPNGYVWECAGAGTLPSEEPAWVIDTETAQLYGTASMIARPFYRPMVHGPVAPEVGTGGAVTARYWRVMVNSVENIYRIEIAELRLRESGSGNVLTDGVVATTNSTRSVGQYDTSQLTDGDPDSRFISDYNEVAGIWFAYDLGSEKAIDTIDIQIQSQQPRAPADISLEYSNDGETWTEAARWDDFNWTEDYQTETRVVPS